MEVPHLPSDVLARAGLELALSEAVSVGEVTGKASPAEPFAKVTSLARSHARTRSISWPVSGQAEQVGDRLTLDRAVAEWHIACELVTVVRSDPRPSDITGVHQVGQDAICGSPRDARRLGDLRHPPFGVLADGQHDLSVMCDERPWSPRLEGTMLT
jgi:hypothetical protein